MADTGWTEETRDDGGARILRFDDPEAVFDNDIENVIITFDQVLEGQEGIWTEEVRPTRAW